MPRSRSERVLSTKKRGQRDSEEDGFSVQELAASFSKSTLQLLCYSIFLRKSITSVIMRFSMTITKRNKSNRKVAQ